MLQIILFKKKKKNLLVTRIMGNSQKKGEYTKTRLKLRDYLNEFNFRMTFNTLNYILSIKYEDLNALQTNKNTFTIVINGTNRI